MINEKIIERVPNIQIEEADAVEHVDGEQLPRLARKRAEQIDAADRRHVDHQPVGPVKEQHRQHHEKDAERRARIVRLVERADPDG